MGIISGVYNSICYSIREAVNDQLLVAKASVAKASEFPAFFAELAKVRSESKKTKPFSSLPPRRRLIMKRKADAITNVKPTLSSSSSSNNTSSAQFLLNSISSRLDRIKSRKTPTPIYYHPFLKPLNQCILPPFSTTVRVDLVSKITSSTSTTSPDPPNPPTPLPFFSTTSLNPFVLRRARKDVIKNLKSKYDSDLRDPSPSNTHLTNHNLVLSLQNLDPIELVPTDAEVTPFSFLKNQSSKESAAIGNFDSAASQLHTSLKKNSDIEMLREERRRAKLGSNATTLSLGDILSGNRSSSSGPIRSKNELEFIRKMEKLKNELREKFEKYAKILVDYLWKLEFTIDGIDKMNPFRAEITPQVSERASD